MARNKYPEETKKLIIDTASRLFIEQGYDQTSIQDIINNLGGLSKGAIYHHFKSKEDILTAVADVIYSGTEGQIRRICQSSDMNGAQKLRAIFKASAFDPAQKEMMTAAPDMLKSPQFLAMYMRDNIQMEAARLIQEILKEGIEDGSIQTDYPKELAEVIMLLGGVWLNPLIYHCEPEEMIEKIKFYQFLMEKLGLDIMDEDMLEKLKEFTRLYIKNS